MSVSSVIDVEAVDLSDSDWEHESSDEESGNCGKFKEIGRLDTESNRLKRRFYELNEDYNKGMKLPFDRNKLYGEMSEIVRRLSEIVNELESKYSTEGLPGAFKMLLNEIIANNREIKEKFEYIDNYQTLSGWYSPKNYNEVSQRTKSIKGDFFKCLGDYRAAEGEGDQVGQETLEKKLLYLQAEFFGYMENFEDRIKKEVVYVPERFLDLLESMQKDYDEIQSSLPFRQSVDNWYTQNNYDEVFNRAKVIKEEFDNCLTQHAVSEDQEDQEVLKRTLEFLKEQFHEHMKVFENRLNVETGEVPKQFLDLLESMQKDYDEIQASFLRAINQNETPAINQNEIPVINQNKTPVSIPMRDLVTGGESVVGLEMDGLPLGELIETDRLPQTNESNSQFFVYTGTCYIIFCGCIWIRKRLQ